ncbi:MAG: hypothetical protein HY744_26030 [Deltaproteobacteria bacterium]|nr:hypothetical protein [Deltaproteobacteria bacterium]
MPTERRKPAERRQVEFICVATGELNIAPGGDRLLMETWCVEEKPTDRGIAMFQADDTAAPRVQGKHVFRVAFKDAVVSVQDVGGQPEVRLHYRDRQGTFHHMDLPLRKGEKYSFAELSTDVVEPIGERRTIEMDR